MHFNQ